MWTKRMYTAIEDDACKYRCPYTCEPKECTQPVRMMHANTDVQTHVNQRNVHSQWGWCMQIQVSKHMWTKGMYTANEDDACKYRCPNTCEPKECTQPVRMMHANTCVQTREPRIVHSQWGWCMQIQVSKHMRTKGMYTAIQDDACKYRCPNTCEPKECTQPVRMMWGKFSAQHLLFYGPKQLSWYSDLLGAGWSGDRIPVGRDFRYPSRLFWGPPILQYNGYWVFPGGKVAGAWHWPPTSI